MCGIAGVASNHELNKDETGNILTRMSGSMKHRGPDDSCSFTDENCGLAMRRLSVIDLTPNLYPFISEDRSKALIFNGEIYNYKELRNELESNGFNFKSNCDAEVILNGYIKYGSEILKKLRGMFAIAIWDSNEKSLFLARDRLGIKPLYYFLTADKLYFASEAKALFSTTGFNLDFGLTETLLGFMFLPESDKTIVKGINKLEPGHYAFFKNGKLNKVKYWSLEEIAASSSNEPASETIQESVERLDDLLNESVKMHLMSDVPLGVMLSGGVDSSLITALLAKNSEVIKPLNTFTAKFDHEFNESNIAAKTAQSFETQHHELNINMLDVGKNISEFIPVFDDLTTFDAGTITTAIISKKIKDLGFKVLLLGEGADELFGGYSWFGISQPPYSYAPKYLKSAMYYYAISRNITFNTKYYLDYWNSKTFGSLSVQNISQTELSVQLPNHLLMKVDKGSMSGSVESRVPYLDHKLVEYIYCLSADKKIKNKTFKFILREVAKKYLPPETSLRKKKGFLFPMKNFLSDNETFVKRVILDNSSVSNKFISLKNKQKLFKKQAVNLIGMQNEYLMWRLFVLDLWYNHYAKKE